jgi:hypothetical protein
MKAKMKAIIFAIIWHRGEKRQMANNGAARQNSGA